MQQVEVKGPGASQLRRNDSLGRIVIGREELMRFGDASLSGTLRRQPGLTISGSEVRMRGLGSGYTLVLVDGQPAPGGFDIASLSPELIERIEIQRSAQADVSALAVAGSINIILKKAIGTAQKTLKLGATHQSGVTTPSLSNQWNWRDGGAAYGLTTIFTETRRREHPLIEERSIDVGGIALRSFSGEEDSRVRKLSMAPRFDLKLDVEDALVWQGLLDLSSTDIRANRLEHTWQGGPTDSPDSQWRALFESWLLKSDFSWSHRFGSSRLTTKAGVEAGNRKGDYNFQGTNGAGVLWLNRAVDSNAFERRISNSGKYLIPIGAGHDVAVGWDGSATRREESRHQRDTGTDGPGSSPFYTLDRVYLARVQRLALFAQDEWALGERLQVYLGLRWEQLNTRVGGHDLAGISTASRVMSPMAQMVWKLPDSSRDQLRLSLARTYKAPLPSDIVPRRYTVNNDNGPAQPDYQGNPQLRPELAWGLDMAFESYFERDAMISASVYARRIRDVMQLRLWQENGAWVSSPANGGSASVRGIEFDGRMPISMPDIEGLSKIELRANLARNWSRVEGVPRPENRLAGQAPLTANLGVDMRTAYGTSAGANLHVTDGWRARTAQSLTQLTGIVRELEVYAALQTTQGQWRATLSNLLHHPSRTGQLYDDGMYSSTRLSTSPKTSLIRIQYEVRL